MNTARHFSFPIIIVLLGIVGGLLALPVIPAAEEGFGAEPRLGPTESRVTQEAIESQFWTLTKLRREGLKIFTTPFNKSDGFGDGPVNPNDTLRSGGRPMLQNNGTYLRVNGLDAQTCLECHSIISMASVPIRLGVGGSGGISGSPMLRPRYIDVEDSAGNGYAEFDGRLINAPALFGAGAVQLVAKEMTAELQQLKAKALANPGLLVELRTKGISFGTLVSDSSGVLDTSEVEGIDDDLVVRPFGRKGEFSSVRQFDLGAMMFHMGMQPVELVGEGVDDDGDGVVNEVLIGEISVLEIFLTTQEGPIIKPQTRQTQNGFWRFNQIGCAYCHRPEIKTQNRKLHYSFPEIETEPFANIFYAVNLTGPPTFFETTPQGGLILRIGSDFKRHDMGPGLAENFHRAEEKQNREFITARLWGVADTAPYLHDGRALTLNEAITLHGGEAEAARDAYLALSRDEKNQILTFLGTLRNPMAPNEDVLWE